MCPRVVEDAHVMTFEAPCFPITSKSLIVIHSTADNDPSKARGSKTRIQNADVLQHIVHVCQCECVMVQKLNQPAAVELNQKMTYVTQIHPWLPRLSPQFSI